MDSEKKKHIDNIWRNDEFGRYIELASAGQLEKAKEIFIRIVSKPPFSFSETKRHYAEQIAKELNNESEFDEYLMMLDHENSALVDFIIANDSLGNVYDYLTTIEKDI